MLSEHCVSGRQQTCLDHCWARHAPLTLFDCMCHLRDLQGGVEKKKLYEQPQKSGCSYNFFFQRPLDLLTITVRDKLAT